MFKLGMDSKQRVTLSCQCFHLDHHLSFPLFCLFYLHFNPFGWGRIFCPESKVILFHHLAAKYSMQDSVPLGWFGILTVEVEVFDDNDG